jgi:hypothetical protein
MRTHHDALGHAAFAGRRRLPRHQYPQHHFAALARHAGAFAYAIFYNYNPTKSAMLAISTSMLQQFAVLSVIFLFLRWQGDEVNRGR